MGREVAQQAPSRLAPMEVAHVTRVEGPDRSGGRPEQDSAFWAALRTGRGRAGSPKRTVARDPRPSAPDLD